MEYTTVPKNYVVEDTSITTILRNVHRNVDLESFPLALYHRNPGLRGGLLYVSHSKTYGASDKTRAGQSKDGWRLLFLKGCSTFLQKLSKYPESHRFVLGSSGIQIWGGSRVGEDKKGKETPRGNQAHRGRGGYGSGFMGRGYNKEKGKASEKNPPKSSAGRGRGRGQGISPKLPSRMQESGGSTEKGARP